MILWANNIYSSYVPGKALGHQEHYSEDMENPTQMELTVRASCWWKKGEKQFWGSSSSLIGTCSVYVVVLSVCGGQRPILGLLHRSHLPSFGLLLLLFFFKITFLCSVCVCVFIMSICMCRLEDNLQELALLLGSWEFDSGTRPGSRWLYPLRHPAGSPPCFLQQGSRTCWLV